MMPKALVIWYILAVPVAGFIIGSLVTINFQLENQLQEQMTNSSWGPDSINYVEHKSIIQEAMADPGIGIKYIIKISDSVAIDEKAK